MEKIKKFTLNNLDCAACAGNIEKKVRNLDGVSYVSINVATGSMLVAADEFSKVINYIHKNEPNIVIEEVVERAGKEPLVDFKKELIPLLLSGLLFTLGLIFYDQLAGTQFRLGVYLVFGIAYLISGRGVLSTSLRDILSGKFFDENFLMSIATLGAIAIGQVPEAVGVMLFYNIGELIQGISIKRSRRSIQALLEIRPDTAIRIKDGMQEVVNPESVQVGDLLLVKPGDKVPLDGRIIQGSSQIDNSPLTGESKPVRVEKGDIVLAGTINMNGLITISVTKPFQNSAIHRILELVELSMSRKARTERFITKFAKVYTPIVVLTALGVALVPPIFLGASLTEWIYRALVVLVISCPCALVISIPLGYFGGVGAASSRGILVKGSNFLDILASVKNIVFDKTGTLTKGEFKVTSIIPRNGFSKDELLFYAVQAEAGSNHPIAESIRKYYGNTDHVKIQNFEEIAGHGIRTVIDGRVIIAGNDLLLHQKEILHDDKLCHVAGTVVHVAVDQQYAGCLLISDELKEDAEETVDKLRSIGVENLIMLTGDHNIAGSGIVDSLKLDSYKYGLNPEGKLSELEEVMSLNDNPGTTAFVGDGINDAPSLARADVGIAMGALGTEAAIETADVVIMTDSLAKIAEAIEIGKKTRRIVWENIAMALVIKGLFITFGILGEASMWQAVFGDMGVALMAVFNSTRTLRFRG
jgi:Cd2+/Zn2+-exporting ATPase